MRKILLISTAMLIALTCGGAAWAEQVVAIPLLSARDLWGGFQSAVWMEGHTRMGSEDVQGYIQGTGADDAIMAVDVEKRWDVFEALVGYLSSAPDGRSAIFEVLADGQSVYKTDLIHSEDDPEFIRVPITGATRIVLRIRPEGYGATAGAAWGSPVLIAGVDSSDLKMPLTLVVDGRKTQIPRSAGQLPKEVGVPLPLRSGISEYRVRVIFDPGKNRVEVETAPLDGE